MKDTVLEQQMVRLRRWQLEAHLALHGWRPAQRISNPGCDPQRRGYLLRNDGRMVVWIHGVTTADYSSGYFLNDHWPLCEWASIPDVPMRDMAKLIDKMLEQQDA